jgi:hypothetical protein
VSEPKNTTESVEGFELKVPELSLGGLTSAAFEYFNQQLKGENEPTAEEITNSFKNNGGSSKEAGQ